MAFRPARERDGFTKVWHKADGAGSFVLRSDEYGKLTDAWRLFKDGVGVGLYEARDLYGDPMTIDLSDVRVIALCSAHGVRDYDHDEDERRDYEKLAGDA